MPRIVLASASPRRRALLEALGIRPQVITSDANEVFEGVPADLVMINARMKRDDVASRLKEPSVVIAADTLVFLEDHVMGKPLDVEEAHAMLRHLSGNTHQVMTGVAVCDTASGREAVGFETTDVTFRKLTDAEIAHFVHAVNPVDRAGAYTVDGPGSLLVESYHGCYQNVLGLPMVRLDRLLRDIGYDLFALMDGARSKFL